MLQHHMHDLALVKRRIKGARNALFSWLPLIPCRVAGDWVGGTFRVGAQIVFGRKEFDYGPFISLAPLIYDAYASYVTSQPSCEPIVSRSILMIKSVRHGIASNSPSRTFGSFLGKMGSGSKSVCLMTVTLSIRICKIEIYGFLDRHVVANFGIKLLL